jgi:hypothetical protein
MAQARAAADKKEFRAAEDIFVEENQVEHLNPKP